MAKRIASNTRALLSPAARQSNRLHQQPLSVYIHWPYCSTKCTYCSFNKYVDPNVDNDRMERALVRELEHELHHWDLDHGQTTIRSVYFGGGTPSLARPSMFISVLETLRKYCNLDEKTEITMEGNPSSTTSLATLTALRDIVGITRYSLGVQSFQPQILKQLGRDHTPATALRSLIDAKRVWPGNVSMDLIMGHEHQTLNDWEKELEWTMEIVDDHLSLYQLTVEPGTMLHKDVSKGLTILPGDELMADMYELAVDITARAGFEQYEVSNFARNGAYSRHNSGHWQRVEYLGIGPGAHGMIMDPVTGLFARTFNVRDPAGWMQSTEVIGTGRRKVELVSVQGTKEEMMMLGMRTKRGVDLQQFKKLCGQDLLSFLDKDALQRCIDKGLVSLTSTNLMPTRRGMAVADELVIQLISQ